MRAWSKLSPRTREAFFIFVVATVLTMLFCSTPYYRLGELKLNDYRLSTWERFATFTNAKVHLFSVRDKTLESGFGDQELLGLLERLQKEGVRRTVLLGPEVFSSFSAVESKLPSNVTVIQDTDPDGARILLRDPDDLARHTDVDGVLRRLPSDHEAVRFWCELGDEWSRDAGDELFLLPPETGGGDMKSEAVAKDRPVERLAEDFAELDRKQNMSGLNLQDQVVVIERASTSATQAAEIPTISGDYTAGQVHLLIAQTLSEGWNPNRADWVPSILCYLILVGWYVLAMSGRRPTIVAMTSLLLLAALGAGSFLLLPIGIRLKVLFILTGVFLASSLTVLSGLLKSRDFLVSFGGAEDAGFSGKESQATMVFTNLPKFLMEMERNHDENLLKYRRDYNEVLAEIAGRYHGKVLDYQGDAQMLGFGLRYDDDTEHAAEATSAALEIVEEVARLAQEWAAEPELLKVSVGVCTGSIALGHLGAIQKQDIAAIGDTTNTAARLMGAAMKHGVGVLVSRPTYQLADGLISGTELPPVELKGKSAPVEVFHATSVDPDWQARNRAKEKEVTPSGGTLSYGAHAQESLLINIVLALIGLVAAYVVWQDRLLDQSESSLSDRMHMAVGLQEADPRIVLVGIDTESVEDEELGGYPWSRGVYAKVVDNLRKTGCEGVFIDVIFKRSRPGDLEGDEYLARMVAEEPRLVLAGTLERDQRNRLEKPRFFSAADEALMEERAQIGLIHNHLDKDGVTRWGFLCSKETASHGSAEADKRSLYPSAAVALLLHDRDRLKLVEDRVYVGERTIPARVDGTSALALIRFGPPATADGQEPDRGSYPIIPFKRLADPEDPIFSDLDGKYILIGQTRTDGLANDVDRVDTLVGKIKGVEVHARVLDGLLNHNFIRPASRRAVQASIAVVALLSFFILTRYRRPEEYFLRLAALIAASILFYVLSFVFWSILFEIQVVLLTTVLVSVSVLVGRNIFTFQALTRVIPAEVAEELFFRREARDRRQVATILLTDIRGYTTLSEGKTAVAMLDVLNEYHKRTVACYARYGGQALTYQGDAQIVVFGVFGNRPNPAADAAASALELQAICDVLREEWGIASREDFDVGAGLCTGEVEVGLLGGGDNLQYSVVGETVRKAHKVQSLSDELSAPVILDEETYLASRGAVQVDDLGMVQPKGLPHEIRLYRAKSVDQGKS
ncbi:MAG: CHASE2 domain-containing protein [Candidatus Eremiobacteraeota bacterium]|nr:CHASE2 domain-containing protein [Candidatus Eremiobacteraeota bacterium]